MPLRDMFVRQAHTTDEIVSYVEGRGRTHRDTIKGYMETMHDEKPRDMTDRIAYLVRTGRLQQDGDVYSVPSDEYTGADWI